MSLDEYNLNDVSTNSRKGEKKTKIRLDRTRDVIYNGNELSMNTYECSSCKTIYHFEEVKHSFCPFCGKKYKYEVDVSV